MYSFLFAGTAPRLHPGNQDFIPVLPVTPQAGLASSVEMVFILSIGHSIGHSIHPGPIGFPLAGLDGLRVTPVVFERRLAVPYLFLFCRKHALNVYQTIRSVKR